jgi:alpha-L-fucosidase
MLVDIVSKNGNLLLNVVQRPDGTLDPEVEQQLAELADWMAIHSEAIHGTRPWQVFGESRVRTSGGDFNENFSYSDKDIRFTTKGKTLYAIALGWPQNGRMLVRSLAKSPDAVVNHITEVSLLGHDGMLRWRQTEDGLEVTLPEKPVSTLTAALRIGGTGLQAMPVGAEVMLAHADGSYLLPAEAAELHGETLRCEMRGSISP